MSVLTNIIPAKARQTVYAIYALLGVALGAVQVAFLNGSSGQPAWLTTTLAVYAFVGTALGLTAAANTPSTPAEPPSA